MRKTVRTAFIKSIPVMAGYLVLGFGFGIISENNGYGFLWVLMMSVFIYAGSMQYVAVSLLTAGASLIATALTTLMVNARHLFYGITMISKYKNTGKAKPYLIFALTDETYSLVCTGKTEDGVDYKKFCFFLTLFNHIYWITGSALGALVGTLLPWDFSGVEFAMTALFITVFVEQWKGTKNHLPAIIGVIMSVLCLVIFGRDNFLIPSMIAISAALSIGKPLVDRKEGDAE
ncbi:MAG: AzlC family ABC transporter permease [Clostridia bacterium]|nr:AzlC family ABC transporter permease [Clostridia bacterium]